MPSKLANYPTAELAHLKINSLLTKLGRATVPESEMIAFMDDYLARIDELEAELAAKSDAPAQPPAPAPAKAKIVVPPTKADAPKSKPELRGVQRAAAAQREGRTQRPTLSASSVPETGWGRAARAQQAINNRKKS